MDEIVIPVDLKDALNILKDRNLIPFAGGTDLMVKYRFDKPEKPFIFIGDLKELRYIKKEGSVVRIGASIRYNELLESKIIPVVFKDIIKNIGSPSIRNMGTIGGNICNASPAADTLPFLYAMDAEVVVSSFENEKIISIFDFIKGPKETILMKNELLKEVRFKLEKFNKYYYRKIGLRNANSLSKVSFFGCAKIIEGKIEDIRIAFGAVSPIVVRDRKIEEMFIGNDRKVLDKIKKDIIERYSEIIRPIDDQRSTKEYRKEIALRLLEDFILMLFKKSEKKCVN